MNPNSNDFFSEFKSEFSSLGNKVNKLFEEMVRGKTGVTPAEARGGVRADVFESAEGLTIELDLPGYAKDQVSIQVRDNILVIRGTRTRSLHANRFFIQERSFEAFERSFNLPDGVDPTQIKAKFDNGVLRIVLPMEANAVEEKPINIE